MEYNVEYYKIKRRKKKTKKIKIVLGMIITFIIMLFGRYKIIKSDSSYINNSKENTDTILTNEESQTVPANNIIKNKEENVLNTSEKNTNKTESKENWETANEEYFKDAIFIGDSRTEGFILNNGLTSKTNSYTHKGLTVDTIFTDKIINMNGKRITIMEALKKTYFSKVYIMLGINEIGWVYSDMFINKYEKIIDEIKKINSNCKIYVESIIPVTEKVSNEHRYIKNSKIKEYNSLLKKMTEEKGVYYLNVEEAVINKNGVLPNEAATDGIHLNKEYCEKWFEYLKNHTIRE